MTDLLYECAYKLDFNHSLLLISQSKIKLNPLGGDNATPWPSTEGEEDLFSKRPSGLN